MKYTTILLTLVIITGCSLQSNSALSVDEITQCVSENTIEVCKSECNDDIPCQQRVEVIAKEKFGNEAVENKTENSAAAGTQNLASDETEKNKNTENNETQKRENTETKNKEIENTINQEEIEKLKNKEVKNDDIEDIENKDETTEQSVSSEAKEQTSQNDLVELAGFSCDNKDGLPDKMKIFAERVDIKKWHWIVPYGGAWELTELEPGQYKIYYAPERNTEPLAKYSEFIADGNGNHDYKILDLTNGGEVRNIKPCDWE